MLAHSRTIAVSLVVSSAILLATGAMSFRSKATKRTTEVASHVRIYVVGDVDAALVDEKGRRSGWYGGAVEDIPDCTVEAYHDDVVQPWEYTFGFSDKSSASYGLAMTPRSDCGVSILVETTTPDSQKVKAVVDSALTRDGREYRWRVSWQCARGRCTPAILPDSGEVSRGSGK